MVGLAAYQVGAGKFAVRVADFGEKFMIGY